VKVALLTGQRRRKITGMRWSEINGAWWTIPGERAKNGLAHRVALGPQMLALLERRRNAGYFVFPETSSDGFFCRRMMELRRDCGVEGSFKFHDLRRTVATLMTSEPVSLPLLTVSKILNHSVEGVTAKVYDRNTYDPEKRAAMARWDANLERVISGKLPEPARVIDATNRFADNAA
jgi:integrase